MAERYLAKPDLLKDRVILITGAGDGIGRTAAEHCAAQGATVVLLGRTQEKLEAVYDSIVAAGHPQPLICPFDLNSTDPAAYQQVADACNTELGRLDGVLLNAGLLGPRVPLAFYDAAQWLAVLQVNLSSNFLLLQPLLPLLSAAPDASVVFTSSGVGHKGRAYWGAYAVSKFGVEGLMQTLADELENTTKVRCNSLNPGGTRTGMRARAYPTEDPATLPEADQHMDLYLWLLGPDSAGTTGQAFHAKDWTGPS